jgi:hypothetical protein
MRAIALALALACFFPTGSANPKVDDLSLNALETLLLAQQSLHAPRPAVRKEPETAREALRLRGGSDLVDPVAMAKAMTALLTVAGLQCMVAPNSAYDTYGIKKGTKKKDKKDNDVLDFIVETNGVASLGNALLSWSIINGAGPMKALGYGYLPHALVCLKNVKDKRATKVGLPEWTQKFLTALNGFFAYSFLTDQSYCPTLSKIASGWALFNGILGALRPKKFAKSWGLKNLDGKAEGLLKHFGFQLAGLGIMTGYLGQGTESTELIGYLWATYLASQIDSMFISKTLTDLKKTPLYVWMLLEAAATATLLK